jgi:HemY protein
VRGVVWLLLIFAVAVIAASTFGNNDGLVSIYWHPWRVDLSFNLFVLFMLVASIVLYALVQAVNALVGLPRRAHEWRLLQRERIAQAALREALSFSFAGRHSRARRAAQRAIEAQAPSQELAGDAQFTALAHLLVAQSAHRLQDRTARDDQLQKAQELAQAHAAARPVGEGARLLAAEWAIEDRDAERALLDLAALPPGVARRTQALRLRLQAARLARQPLEALRTARLLAKHQAFAPAAAQGLLRALAIDLLDSARDGDQLLRAWRQLDDADRADAFIAAQAAQRAGHMGIPREGRAWLRPFWERLPRLSEGERAAVTRALLDVMQGLPNDWLPLIEGAVRDLPTDPTVAHAAGRALAERQLWGRARRLLEFAANAQQADVARRRDAWRTLAKLAEQEGDTERANECHRQASTLG